MRRMTNHHSNHPHDRHDDRGATTIFIVLAMPFLLLFGSLVFDGGRGVLARRQTQNAADAGALAKATDCALGTSATDFIPYETNGAVLDGAPVCGAGETTVAMKRDLTLTFDLFGGNDSRTVTRSATAKWGTLGGAATLPIVISDCEFDEALLDGTDDIILYLDDPKPQSGCSSLPGGFSQLLGSGCDVPLTAGDTAPGKTGGDLQDLVPCITNPTAPLPQDVLIPIYDAAACQALDCKGKGPYTIKGFAMFHVTGYKFNGNNYAGTLGNKCPEKPDPEEPDPEEPDPEEPDSAQPYAGKYCIQGDFIEFVTSQGTPGPGTDYGTFLVYLSL